MPYITDAGASCGANFNGLGSGAAITIVGGHEMAETVTDQFPSSGWLDSRGSEIGDKCAWITSGRARRRPLPDSRPTRALSIPGRISLRSLHWSNSSRLLLSPTALVIYGVISKTTPQPLKHKSKPLPPSLATP